jgi:hypothetical protein
VSVGVAREFEQTGQVPAAELKKPVGRTGLHDLAPAFFDAGDRAPVATDGALILEVALAMVSDSLCRNRLIRVGQGVEYKSPGGQGLLLFDHEIPVLARSHTVV